MLTQIGSMRCPAGAILTVIGYDTTMTVQSKDQTYRHDLTNLPVNTDDMRPGMYLVDCPVHGLVEATPKYWSSEVAD